MAKETPPVPFSIRMSRATLGRLEADAKRRGEPKARTAERLIDEGLRMAAHPGIVFKDGPAGRRAALAAGPDVWEVVETLKDSEATGEDAIRGAADWGGLTEAEVRLALRYYGDFPEEIDGRIVANRQEAKRVRETWERAQAALS